MSRNFSTSVLLIFFFSFSLSISSLAQDGESIFKSTCAACHTTTGRKLIGPGLANIHDKRTKEWFTKFVRSSQTLINSGDAEAVKIFEALKTPEAIEDFHEKSFEAQKSSVPALDEGHSGNTFGCATRLAYFLAKGETDL